MDARFTVEPVTDEEATRLYEGLLGAADSRPEFIANSLKILARDPELLAAFVGLVRATVYRHRHVDPGLKWLVGHVVSTSAGCRYCAAHAANLGVGRAGLPAAKLADVWNFETSPLFDEAERAALRVAVGAGTSPNTVTQEDMAELVKHFGDDGVVEIVSVIALYGWANRWNDTLATPLEDRPRRFAEEQLTPAGWHVGKHGE